MNLPSLATTEPCEEDIAMQALKTALIAGAITLASTMAFGQAASVNDSMKAQQNLGIDKGAAKSSTDADVNAKASVKAPGANATTGAEVSGKSKIDSHPSGDTAAPGNMNKMR
jgi:hypothetical protein